MSALGKRTIEVPELFDSRPLGYAQCITAGDLIFVAGQGGDVDEHLQLVSTEFAPQARQALANVRRALAAAGATPADVTATTVYLTDMAHLREFGAIKAEVLPELEATSTAVGVSRLALPGMLIEMTAIAVRSRA